MAFRTQDLRKTVRRDRGSSLRRLYPRLLRDDSIMPKVSLAIRFFETKLGLTRRELDGEALVQLFGDPKLARCLVGCLARAYRYRTRTFADLLGAERAAALAGQGLATPCDLRFAAYAEANRAGGFVRPDDRARFAADLVPGLDLAEVEQLLWLDADNQAILTRVGLVPTAEETVALYNLRVLETLLRSAREVRLVLRGEQGVVDAVCARHGVRARVDGRTIVLSGWQDALGSWTRHGTRVARAALTLLGSGALGSGEAEVQLGDETYAVKLDAALLADALPARGWSAPAATWEAAERLVEGLLAERRAGRLVGWRLKRWPEPIVSAQGAVWAEFALTRGSITIHLLPLTARQLRDEAAALTELASRAPVIVLVSGAAWVAPDGVTTLPLDGEGAAGELAACLERTFPLGAADATPDWLAALVDATRAAGSLAESELARRLDCAEELVAGRLATLDAADIVYVDGFGLCAETFLDTIRELIAEEGGRNDGRLDLGLLGRKVRALVGRNEGLHALIAYCSGDLRLAA